MESSQKVSESIRILRYLEQHNGVNADQISSGVQISLQTLNRTLNTLRDFKFVSKTSDRKWKLGTSLLRIAATVPSALLEISKEFVEQLVVVTGGSAILAVPQYPNFIVIMQRDGRQGPLLLESLASVGYPLHKAPPGIAILGHLPAPQQETFSGDGTEWQEVERQCRHIREFGWAIVPSQIIEGRHGICAPIFGHDGTVAGSLTLALPSSKVLELESFVEPLLASVNAITASLAQSERFTVKNEFSL